MAVVAVAVGGGGVVEQIVENRWGERGNRVAVRGGRKLDDDDDSPALPTVEYSSDANTVRY